MKKKPLFDDDELSYTNSDGYVVLKEEFLLKRGYCCGNGCLHCPFEYKNVLDEKRKQFLISRREQRKTSENE
jgi:hypothetical protein